MKQQRGSILAVVFILSLGLSMILGSVASFSTTEHRGNRLALLQQEARAANEALIEYGFAELVDRFNRSASLSKFSLAPRSGANPLELPDEFYDEFQQKAIATGSGTVIQDECNLVLPAKPYNGMAAWGTYDTELIGGIIEQGRKYVNPAAHPNDPLRGRHIRVNEVNIYARTLVRDSLGHEARSHARHVLQMRDSPLFSGAIEYNMTMEIAPGPAMEVHGPVHANGDMYIQSNASLEFHQNVTCTGQILHGRHPSSGQSTSNGAVRFMDDTGTLVAMEQSGTWIDHRQANWGTESVALWDRNVEDAAHGVANHALVAFDDYLPVDPADPTDHYNPAWTMIEPTRTINPSAYANSDAFKKAKEQEKQKFSYKAGLVIEVTDTVTGDFEVYTYDRVKKGPSRDPQGEPIYTGGGTLDTLSGSSNFEIEKIPLNKTNLESTATVFTEKFTKSADPSDPNGDEKVDAGIYDMRRGQGLDTVEIDMGKLKALVEANNETVWQPAALKSGLTSTDYKPQNWWNGVVYVKLPDDSSNPPGSDGVQAGEAGWGVIVFNGQRNPLTGNPTLPSHFALDEGIPNPRGYWDEIDPANNPFKDIDYGLTVATNQPLYIQGHFNADGDISNQQGAGLAPSRFPDVDDPRIEPPVALAADAITVLSSAWLDTNSIKRKSSRHASNTEVSAAFLMGLVRSGYHGTNYSGGVENFPRFLEDWGGDKLSYRGSLVCLFGSEIATEKWGSGNIYSPPNRDWGFNDMFAQGYFPPGTPNTRTFRSINYRFLTAAEWQTELATLQAQFP